MRPDYLTACLANSICNRTGNFQSNFLPEESYEWGDKTSFSFLSKTQILWSEAGRKWRVASQLKIQNEIEIQNENKDENENKNKDENKNENENENENENQNQYKNKNERKENIVSLNLKIQKKPFSSIKTIIFGQTLPPPDTLYRMVLYGGGQAVVIPDLNYFLHCYNVHKLFSIEIENKNKNENENDNKFLKIIKKNVDNQTMKKIKIIDEFDNQKNLLLPKITGEKRNISEIIENQIDECQINFPCHLLLQNINTIIAPVRDDFNKNDQLIFASYLKENLIQSPWQLPSYLLDCLCEINPSSMSLPLSLPLHNDLHDDDCLSGSLPLPVPIPPSLPPHLSLPYSLPPPPSLPPSLPPHLSLPLSLAPSLPLSLPLFVPDSVHSPLTQLDIITSINNTFPDRSLKTENAKKIKKSSKKKKSFLI